jgi:hypothetical protein
VGHGTLPIPHHDVRSCRHAPPGAFLPFGRSERGAPRPPSTPPAAAFPCLLNLPLPAPAVLLRPRGQSTVSGLRSRPELSVIVRLIPPVRQPPATPRVRKGECGGSLRGTAP